MDTAKAIFLQTLAKDMIRLLRTTSSADEENTKSSYRLLKPNERET